jgi:hypothetical protein
MFFLIDVIKNEVVNGGQDNGSAVEVALSNTSGMEALSDIIIFEILGPYT